jgi:hypothetical protein
MPNQTTTQATPPPSTPYNRAAIYQQTSPFNPSFMRESVRAMFRNLPIDPTEPQPRSDRRMHSALLGLSALHPRDEIEVMLGVQAMSAHHAALACFRLGMNHHRPNGDSTRHIAAACSAARTFDSMLRALERRQAKPLSIPIGRPEPQNWDTAEDPTTVIAGLTETILADDDPPRPQAPQEPDPTWTNQDQQAAQTFLDQEKKEKENEGLDIANTEGILPCGGMILTEHPTPQQKAYMGRRLGLMYKREYAENLRNGLDQNPKIRGIRPGDLIP